MPIYEYSCEVCGKITEALFSIEERPGHVKCECGVFANRIISTPTVVDDIPEHWDFDLADKAHPLGQVVKSRKHNNQLLKEQGLFEYGPSRKALEHYRTKKRTSVS